MQGDRPPLRAVRGGPDDPADRPRSRAETMALVQGGYFAATGVWPFISMRSFEAVTGPKTDRWLVKTVGGLVGVVGGVLIAAGVRRRVTPEIAAMAAGTAAVLAAIDVVYTARRVIRPVYLADAVGEALLLAGWARAVESVAEEDGGGA
ncbi:MAG TPA: hypothetical protein VFS20_21065 [Longimicrobium sp.]|nr:hypothetical protein [Longimicrobium sp.]